MIAGSSLFFKNSYERWCVYVTMAPHYFAFKLTWKFSQLFKNIGGKDLFSPRSSVGHSLRPIFMLWLVKIWQVSSCGKLMQHLETCLLWQLKLTEFCVNFLTASFLWMYKMKYGCYQESSLIRGQFVYCSFVWEMRHLSKSEIRFRMASFLFLALLDV